MDMHDCKCGASGHYMQGTGVVTCGKRGCKQDVFIASGGATVDEIIEGAKDIRIAELEAQLKTANDKYYELLHSVQTKTPGKTRHEIALMHIQQSERGSHTAYANSLTGEE